jgi:hypothetical protein
MNMEYDKRIKKLRGATTKMPNWLALCDIVINPSM